MSVNAAREVAERLRLLAAKAASDAPLAACKAVSQAAETAVKVTLSSSTHPKGTKTPSQPGQPPSLVTGRLRRSVHRTTPRLMGDGIARCIVGSTVIYAPVHEFGPVVIRAKRFPQLGNPQVGFFGQQVTIPRRPFLAPAMLLYRESGMATRVAVDAWRAALDL